MTVVLLILVCVLWLAVVVLTSQLNRARERRNMDVIELNSIRLSNRTLDFLVGQLRHENYHLREHIRMIHTDRTWRPRKSRGDAGPN